jgi:hypothetical protein
LGLNRGKLAVVITTGIGRTRPGLHEANNQIVRVLEREGMDIVGRLEALGNPPCLSCGFGENCPMSSIPFVFGEDARITPDKFCRVEDQEDIWKQAQHMGSLLQEAIEKRRVLSVA